MMTRTVDWLVHHDVYVPEPIFAWAVRQKVNRWTGEPTPGILKQLWLKGNASNHGTWGLHAGIAGLLTLVTPLGVPTGFYLLREIEQVINHLAHDEPLDPLDHVMDVVSPAAAEGLLRMLGALIRR